MRDENNIPDNVDEEMYLAGIESFHRGHGLALALYMMDTTVPMDVCCAK